MKTLVAGGAGFIGSHLIDALLEKGHEVVCIDNLSLGTKENIAHLQNNNAFTFYKMDICDAEELEKIIAEEQIEYIFHLAANSDIQQSAKNPQVEFQNTYSTTYHLLEAARKKNIKKFFFASTSAVYGDKKDELLDENTANLSPISYYGGSKLGGEALICAFSYMNDMQVLVFRFPNVIGPRLTHGVIHDFISRLQQNPKELVILGNGQQTKPYVYVLDLVDAIIQFMDVKERGITLYNVGVETATSVTRIADIICEEMKLENVKYNYTGGEGGWKGDVPRFQYSLKKIHDAGWTANYTSDEAVRLTVQKNL